MYLKSLIDGISMIPNIPISVKEETKKKVQEKGLKYIYEILLNENAGLKINPNDTQRIQRAYNVFVSTGKMIEEWNKKNKNVYRGYFPNDVNGKEGLDLGDLKVTKKYSKKIKT